MIDFISLRTATQDGQKLIESLKGDEEVVIQQYSLGTAKAVLDMANQHGFELEDIVLNAVKVGMATGLQLQISQGKVERRRDQ